jgi:hypothetical protein
MTKHSGGATVNRGPAPKREDEARADVTGNAAEKGEAPSPADRDRGETSSTAPAAPVDLDTAHDRAS